MRHVDPRTIDKVELYQSPVALLESPQRMRARYREKLIHAFETGKYKQCRGYLNMKVHKLSTMQVRDELYCAWGVAYREAGVTDYSGKTSEAGELVINTYGMYHLYNDFVRLNDTERKTFPEIAEVMRRQPENFFKGENDEDAQDDV